jgi:Ni/Co efflux regulator RcnB
MMSLQHILLLRRPAMMGAVAGSLLFLMPAMAEAQDHGGDPHGPPPSGDGSAGHHGGGPHGGNPHGGGWPGGDPHDGGWHGGHPPHGGYAGYGHGWGYYGGGRIIDRGRPGWWRGNPAFVGYSGVRRGYYFAPGYGYYAAPIGYGPAAWVVGVTLPRPMRRYVVVEPAAYGLAPPPPGQAWYYAGSNFVLVTRANGVIVQSVAGGW